MAFFRKKAISSGSGRLYVLRLTLDDGNIIHKVGMTYSDRVTDRMMEILRSWFTAYRYVPHTVLKLSKETGVPKLLEEHTHKILNDCRWIPDKKVSGHKEMFIDVDEEALLNYLRNFDYSVLLDRMKIDTKDYNYIISQIESSNNFQELPF